MEKYNADSWVCPTCNKTVTGKFCSDCGTKRPEKPQAKFCKECGAKLDDAAKFCPECGKKVD